jgi:SAM-dependent methyltransferase
MNLKNRSREPELMDSEGSPEEILSALKELKQINRFLGGNKLTADALIEIKKKYDLRTVNILDAGSGNSDILINNKIAHYVNVVSIDKNFLMCRLVKEMNGTSAVCGNINEMPLREKSFDVVHCSLFLHHFDDEEIVSILNLLCSMGRYSLVINDLQRSFAAYYGFKLLSSLFSRNRLVRNDGLISVKRGFRRRELENFLLKTGFNFKIEWRWAFRWLIIIDCNEKI